MKCRSLPSLLLLLCFLGFSAASQAADPPLPNTAPPGEFAVLRPSFVKELQDANVTIKDRKLEAAFLKFDGDFAVFTDPANKDFSIYIPRNQILFLVTRVSKP